MADQPKFTPLDIPYEEIQAPTLCRARSMIMDRAIRELEIRGPNGDEHEQIDAIILNGVRFIPEQG
jgi:hypothetical protein